MDKCCLLLFFVAISSIFRLLRATSGDAYPIYIECVGHCKESGCVGGKCFQHCNFSSGEKPIDGPWYLQEPLYLRWKQWDCLVIVDTTVCLPEKKKGRNMVLSLSNIMGNGHSDVFMGSRDVELTEKLYYSSVVAFIGYSLLVAVLRAFNVRDEASRVMVAAPIVAFVTTHI